MQHPACLELIQGDDYLTVDGRAIRFSAAGRNWPAALTSAKLLLRAQAGCSAACQSAPALEVDGVYTPATTSQAALLSFDVPRSASLKLAAGVRLYTYEVRALLPSNSVITLERGLGSVIAGNL